MLNARLRSEYVTTCPNREVSSSSDLHQHKWVELVSLNARLRYECDATSLNVQLQV